MLRGQLRRRQQPSISLLMRAVPKHRWRYELPRYKKADFYHFIPAYFPSKNPGPKQETAAHSSCKNTTTDSFSIQVSEGKSRGNVWQVGSWKCPEHLWVGDSTQCNGTPEGTNSGDRFGPQTRPEHCHCSANSPSLHPNSSDIDWCQVMEFTTGGA